MDRQTDVGDINLIGGLVTRNPPKNKFGNLPKFYFLPASTSPSITCLKTTFTASIYFENLNE